METGSSFEILIIDGGSTDDTRRKINNFINSKNTQAKIYIIDNKKKIVSSGLNIGILKSRGEIIFRCDAHCTYEKNYFAVLLTSHRNYSDQMVNIGSLMDTQSTNENYETVLVKEVLKMPIAIGNSFRNLNISEEKIVETVPFGSWSRQTIERVGLFDENFIRGQDMEHNSRLNKVDGKCVLVPFNLITYFARQDISHLLKMIYQYGFWKVQVMKKNSVLYFRPLTLFFAIAFMIFGIIGCIIFKKFFLFIPALIYLILIALSILAKRSIPNNKKLRSSILIIQIHFMYFFGMVRSFFMAIKNNNLAENETKLTR